MASLRLIISQAFVALVLLACSDDGPGETGSVTPGDTAVSGQGVAGGAGTSGGTMAVPVTGGTMAPPVNVPGGTNDAAVGAAPDAQAEDAPSAGGDAGAGDADTADGAATDAGAGPQGPKDGDPDAPVVELDDVPCREGSGGSSLNATIDGRQLALDYPCGKHEGAHMTVILNLHGTLIGGASFLYQRAYFSAYKLVDSHNLIVLTPQSVSRASLGAQWGNTDDGTDVPHLLALIDWVYTSFAKFQIRGLWVGGHSWGARFISDTAHPVGMPFACHPMLEDKVKGVIGMSRLRMPTCASRLSMISTRGEEEDITLLDMSAVAMEHGCTTPIAGPDRIGNNEYRYFEDCSPGFIHDDYHMLGKGHIDSMDDEVVRKIVERIKSTEL